MQTEREGESHGRVADSGMSNTSESESVHQPVRLDEASRAAIVAAVASGQAQTEVARQFNVHRNTVWSLCNNVKSVRNPANPLSPDYKEALKVKAIGAIHDGLAHKKNPYKAAELGVEVMKGIGEFQSGNQVNVSMATILTQIPEDIAAEMVLTPMHKLDNLPGPDPTYQVVDSTGLANSEET
jgi:DNA-binding CsgD family transcriptional regulator